MLLTKSETRVGGPFGPWPEDAVLGTAYALFAIPLYTAAFINNYLYLSSSPSI